MQRQEVGPTDNSKADVRASTTTTAGSGGMSEVEAQKGSGLSRQGWVIKMKNIRRRINTEEGVGGGVPLPYS